MEKSVDYKNLYDTFREISRMVHSPNRLEEVMNLVVWKSTELLNASGALLRLHDPETDQFTATAAYGSAETLLSKEPVPKEEIRRATEDHQKIYIFPDITQAPRVQSAEQKIRDGIRMLVDVPLYNENEVKGIVRVYFKKEVSFAQAELDFLVSMAEQCECALQKTQLIETQQSQYNFLALQTAKLSALGRMSAAIAHEINNPLGGILLYSSHMFRKASEDHPFKKGLETIMQETSRCKGIIQELLEFSRDQAPVKALQSLNEVINKALNILENEFYIRHIAVTKQLDEDLSEICLDVNKMEQVFVNLLLNAAEAIDHEGSIDLESRYDAIHDQQIVEIRDDGCGISTEDISKLFEPFYTTKSNGSGLGLAVSYGIIRNHNGTLTMASKSDGGTHVTIALPASRQISNKAQSH
ncbi:MAG TPA: ATP-binding protein [Desulfosalsimonadaceae bacterium]|nr:ATP-binding protein [Desulfosalsimonadaceae bacterium]